MLLSTAKSGTLLNVALAHTKFANAQETHLKKVFLGAAKQIHLFRQRSK